MSLKILWKFKFLSLFYLLNIIIYTFLLILDMYLSNEIINALFNQSDDWFFYFCLILIAFSITILSGITKNYFFNFLELKVNDYMRKKIFHKISFSKYQKENVVGKVQSKIFDNVPLFSSDVVFANFEIFSNLLILILSISLLWIYHWSLSLIAFSFGFISLLVPALTGAKGADLQSKSIKIENDYKANIDNLVNQRNKFYLMHRINFFNDFANKVTNNKNSKSYKIYKKMMLVYFPSIFIGIIAQISSPIATSILSRYNFITISVIGVSSFLFGFVFSSIQTLPQLIHGLIVNRKQMQEDLNFEKISSQEKVNKIIIKDFNPKLKDKKLYKKDLNFAIENNSKIVILGKNGIGKSVFFEILQNAQWKHEGSVLINKKEKTELLDNEKVLFLNDKSYIFNGSLKDNITFLNDDYSEKEIKSSIEKVCLKMDLNENIVPSKLSSGQMQKINLARMFLYKPDFVFLNESLNNIDKNSYQKIASEMLKMQSAVIWITHRKDVSNNGFKKIEIE